MQASAIGATEADLHLSVKHNIEAMTRFPAPHHQLAVPSVKLTALCLQVGNGLPTELVVAPLPSFRQVFLPASCCPTLSRTVVEGK